MRKIFIIVLVLIVIGVAYWLISPLFITNEVHEKLEDIENLSPSQKSPTSVSEVIAQGKFVGLEGHRAEGLTKLIKVADKYYIRFEDDFRITNGPDLFVYFGKNGQYDPSTKIARLKGNIGGQNYEVPASINPTTYNEIWVWCRAFSVAFGKVAVK